MPDNKTTTPPDQPVAMPGSREPNDQNSAKEQARQAAEKAKEHAAEAADKAKAKARSFADDQKEQAASRVGGVADALRSAAGDLDDQDQQTVAGYAREAASGLDRVSDALSRRSVDDLLETVEDFARQQPVAFLGGAVLTGFVLSRFAKSSAERRRGQGASNDSNQYRSAQSLARQHVGGHASPVPHRPAQENS